MKKPHVLIVEDSQIAQVVLQKQMTGQGCTVDAVSDGDSALRKSMITLYDLILMDIGLGDGLDGFETTLLIKKNSTLNSNTPVMAITAHDEIGYKKKAASIGMVGYFTKPFKCEEAESIMNFLITSPENVEYVD